MTKLQPYSIYLSVHGTPEIKPQTDGNMYMRDEADAEMERIRNIQKAQAEEMWKVNSKNEKLQAELQEAKEVCASWCDKHLHLEIQNKQLQARIARLEKAIKEYINPMYEACAMGDREYHLENVANESPQVSMNQIIADGIEEMLNEFDPTQKNVQISDSDKFQSSQLKST